MRHFLPCEKSCLLIWLLFLWFLAWKSTTHTCSLIWDAASIMVCRFFSSRLFSSRKMAITNSYYGREAIYSFFRYGFFDTNYSLCRLWQKHAGIVTNAAVWILFTFDYPHFAKCPSDVKQNGTQEKTPFSVTDFHTLSHGVFRFVASVSFRNHWIDASDWLSKNFNHSEGVFLS